MNEKAIALLFAAAGLSTSLAAQGGDAPFTVSGRGYDRLQDAVDAIGAGAGTVRIAPGTYRQCAVQGAGRVTFQAAKAGTAIFDGTACEGKAALVLRGAASTVDGLVFQNMRVPDANGAGIRMERGDLTVRETLFRNSEQGILSADDPASTISIARSTFSNLGRCDRGLSCAHGIYVNGYGALRVTESRFERGAGGHYLKSRAPVVEVTNSSFDDSGGRQTNYMIDLPAGAVGRISGNRFVQGRDKENWSAFITVAVEGKVHPSAGLQITGNEAEIAPGVSRQTAFVADASGERLAVGPNRLGRGLTAVEKR